MGCLRIMCAIGALVAAMPAMAETVSVSREGCARLARHVPDDSVAYKPGVDAHGRAVAPADYGGGQALQLPDKFQIPITVDLAKRFGIPKRGDANYTGDLQVGLVEVDREGHASFNGQPLTRDDEIELARLCQESGG